MAEQHDHTHCPTYKLLIGLQDKFHSLDKQAAVDTASLNIQYGTIITLLSESKNQTDELSKRMGEMEKTSSVTEYQVDRTTNFLDRLSWGTVAKIVTILLVLGGIVLKIKT